MKTKHKKTKKKGNWKRQEIEAPCNVGSVDASADSVSTIDRCAATNVPPESLVLVDRNGLLASGIAHQINNDLYAVMLSIGLVVGDLEDGTTHKNILKECKQANSRATNLLQQVFDLYRSDDQLTAVIQIVPIIERTVAHLHSSMPIAIRCKSAIDLQEDRVSAMPAQIERIIVNLCANAVNDMSKSGSSWDINIKDTVAASASFFHPDRLGCKHLVIVARHPVAEKSSIMQQQIYSPNFSASFNSDGTEINLAIVAGIVKLLQGVLLIECDAKNTIFSIFLPLANTLTD